MRICLRRKFLLAVQTDLEAVLTDRIWNTRCLHCRSRLQVRDDGEALGHSTLEHVIPKSWFGENAAKTICSSVGGDADNPRNLALACTRCNHNKGKNHDASGPNDARAVEVINALLAKRITRWRTPELSA